MRRVREIADQLEQVSTINSLTGVFESIASMRIGRIKDQVLASNNFFLELWQLYSQLQVKTSTPLLQAIQARHTINKAVFVLITSESSFSGDIDRRIVETMMPDYHPDTVDLIVLGYHGVSLLSEKGIHPLRFYRLPSSDAPVDVTPVIANITPYRHAEIFYQKFVSLSRQQVERIELLSAVKSLGEGTAVSKQTISPEEFLFEPSIDEVVLYLERVMMEIALGQTILDSRLSQLASRFTAMQKAKDRSKDLMDDLRRRHAIAKRAEADERIREVITAMRAV